MNTPLHQKQEDEGILKPSDPTPKFHFDDSRISIQDTDLEVPAFLRRNS